MSGSEAFFDSNIILYLTSSDTAKAEQAENLLAAGGVVSVQVLNECAAVSRRKFKMEWSEIWELLRSVRAVCTVEPLSLAIHERGISIAERFGFRVYDSMLIAAALQAGCTTLYSEDLQHGQLIDQLAVRNPFAHLRQ